MAKKKIFSLIIVSFIFFLILSEIGIRLIIYLKKDYLFQTKEHLNFYKQSTNTLHHLRDVTLKPDNPRDFLFNNINQFNKEFKTILFQGDSRTEQLNSFNKKFIENTNFNIINGGITSFSPSNMSLQFDLLVNNFDIKPNIVVALIDPTDFGDELCRYRKNTIYENGKIKKIKMYESRGEIYFLKNVFFLSEVYHSNKPKFLFLPNLIKQIVKYNLNYTENCRYDEMQRYLITENKEAENYFKSVIKIYINNIRSYGFVDKIYLVSYPHIQHLDKSYYNVKYNVKISEIINSLNLKKVLHIDLYKKNIFDKYKNDYYQVFIKGDHASHLTSTGVDVFYKYILNKIIEDNNKLN